MKKNEEITLSLTQLKELILQVEPSFLAQVVLQVNGFGRAGHFHSGETYWTWDKEVIQQSDKEKLQILLSSLI